ncbi:hypothetical protein [Mangrovicella endophytica]|uniref:hypothetical protein n=1 Tax=Mangrovicella endophytica TaxID=2066697 RepID=UPI0018E4B9FE|nr:hypothetical protein [Mangrovicella endophytica]
MSNLETNATTSALDKDETRQSTEAPPMQEKREEQRIPGDQERPLSKDEVVDVGLEDTFPASDPVTPKHIDGPNN